MIKKNEVTHQFLSNVGINAFAVSLVVESFNRVSEATPDGVSFVFKGIRVTLKKEVIINEKIT